MKQNKNKNTEKLDGLRWWAIDQYAFTGKVHFQKMLSVTLTFETMTSKISSVSRGPCSEQWW